MRMRNACSIHTYHVSRIKRRESIEIRSQLDHVHSVRMRRAYSWTLDWTRGLDYGLDYAWTEFWDEPLDVTDVSG